MASTVSGARARPNWAKAQDPLEAARALGLSLGAAVREEGGDLIVTPD